MVNIVRYADVCTQNNRVGATIAKKTFLAYQPVENEFYYRIV